MFSDDFIKNLPEDYIDVLTYFCNKWMAFYKNHARDLTNDKLASEFIIESVAFLESFSENYDINISEFIMSQMVKRTVPNHC